MTQIASTSRGDGICADCGAELRPGAKFCRLCGNPVNTPTVPVHVEPHAPAIAPVAAVPVPAPSAAVLPNPAAPLAAQDKLSALLDRLGQPRVLLSSIAVVVLLVAAIVGGRFWRQIEGSTGSSQLGSGYATAGAQSVYATRIAFVRNMPTALGSQIVGSLARGESIQGLWTTGTGGASQWLQISGGPFAGSYISATNLSSRQRPTTVRVINQDVRIAQQTVLRELPDVASASIEPLSPGLAVHISVEVEGGWMEIERKSGGVGYVPAGAFGAVP